MFAIDGMWLSNTELKKLNAVHCTCIGKILKIQIQHSFYSRISNDTVLNRAKAKLLRSVLTRRQLSLFGRIALMANSNILRPLVFDDDSYTKPRAAPRRRGRPRAC